MGECLLNSHMSQYTASCFPPRDRNNSHTSFSSTLVQLILNSVQKTLLSHSPGYNNLYSEVIVCLCVCVFLLFSVERNQWAGKFLTTSGAGETLQVGRWDVKGRFWRSGQLSMWPLSTPTINWSEKLSGSDLSSFLVPGQVFNRMQTERLFFKKKIFIVHLRAMCRWLQ